MRRIVWRWHWIAQDCHGNELHRNVEQRFSSVGRSVVLVKPSKMKHSYGNVCFSYV